MLHCDIRLPFITVFVRDRMNSFLYKLQCMKYLKEVFGVEDICSV
jgi:hypothetical protein